MVNRCLDSSPDDVEARIVGAPLIEGMGGAERRIGVMRPYLAGATPDVTTFFKRFIETGDPGELSGVSAPYAVPVEVPAATLHRGYSSGTCFAASGGMAVPFLDARAYEDVAQSQLSYLVCSGDVQHQAGVVEHRRHVGARVINSDQYIDALLGFHLMHRYFSTVHQDSFVMRRYNAGPQGIFRELGRKLWRDAERGVIEDSDLRTLVKGYTAMADAMRAARVEGSETFLNSAEDISMRIVGRLRQLQRANALLYFYWPEVRAAAREE
ncbi:MAG: hypothetical protein EBZ48_06860 [Proteobacteria bacterium]|nr:hypothetical protein [Pseudomonadota bacterium]